MLVLLPPSEGKSQGGDGIWTPDDGRFGAQLGRQRRRVVDALTGAVRDGDDRNRSRVLGAKGPNLAAAIDDALALALGPAARPAVERYTGVVWTHLAPDDLPEPAATWVVEHVAVVSGLLGLAGAGDPVPAYRLKMSVVLGGLGRLSRWWRPHLDDVLAGHAVVDLLPQEHADAVPPRGTGWVSVRFATADGRAAGHHGKAAKGRFARHLALGMPTTADEAIDLARAVEGAGAVAVEPTATGRAVTVVIEP